MCIVHCAVQRKSLYFTFVFEFGCNNTIKLFYLSYLTVIFIFVITFVWINRNEYPLLL